MALPRPEDLQGPVGESIAEALRSENPRYFVSHATLYSSGPSGDRIILGSGPIHVVHIPDPIGPAPSRRIAPAELAGTLRPLLRPFLLQSISDDLKARIHAALTEFMRRVEFTVSVASSVPDPLTLLSRLALDRPPGELTFEELRSGIVGITLRRDGREVKGIVDLDLMAQSGGDYEKSLRRKIERMER